jgi:hypothetical protein
MNTPDTIDKLAREKAGGAESLRLSWLQALQLLPDLPLECLETLARALPAPDTARQLAIFLARDPDPETVVSEFLADVDESGESLKDWLEAFGVFANFIKGTAHRPGFASAAGYLHCCEAVVASGSRYETFPMAVQTMLETYGYEGNG